MAASTAAIANLALAHLGVSGTITTLSSDTTTEGKACRTFYDRAVVETLAAHRWQFATKEAALTLVEEIADTDEREWRYRYRLPEDCVTPVRIKWGVRNPRPEQEVPFRLLADDDSTAYDAAVTYAAGDYVLSSSIWYRALRTTINDTPASSPSDWVAVTAPPMYLDCDQEDAILVYVADLDDPTRYPVDFESAVAALLAFYVAPSVTVNGSAADLRAAAYGLWQQLVAQAKVNDFMARQRDVPPVSSWQGARHYRLAR